MNGKKNLAFLVALAAMATASLLCPSASIAQKPKILKYSGRFEEGNASYSYYDDPATMERIMHGKYSWTREANGYVEKKTGKYENGKRTGTWTYQTSGGHVVDGSGFRRNDVNTGSYKNGRPDGLWTMNHTTIGSAQSAGYEIQLQCRANFKEGTFVDDFSFHSKTYAYNYTISGQFNGAGYMVGKWTTTYADEGNGEMIEDIREYRNGFLIKAVLRNIERNDVYAKGSNDEIIAKLDRLDSSSASVVGFKFSDTPHDVTYEHYDNRLERLKFAAKFLMNARDSFTSAENDIATSVNGFWVHEFEITDPALKIRELSLRIAKFPNEANPYFSRGLDYWHRKVLDSAQADFTSYLRLTPDQGHAYHYRGRIRFERGDTIGAISDLGWSIAKFPEQGDVQADYALFLYMDGRYEESLRWAGRATMFDNKLTYARYCEASATMRMGKVDQARQLYSETRIKYGEENVNYATAYLRKMVKDNYKVVDATSILKDVFGVEP